MEFPRFVFRCPGAKTCNGGTYDQLLVESESEHAAAVKAGYFPTLPEALKAPVAEAPEPESEDAEAIPTPKASTPKAPRQAQRKR